jgi:hypothetical protein
MSDGETEDVDEPEDVTDDELEEQLEPDATDDANDPDDDRPTIEEDERAEIDLSDVDLDAVDDEETDDGDDESDDSSPNIEISRDEGDTWGDMYVDVLAVILIALVDEYGDGDRQMTAEDIEELANQPPIALNEQADRVMENMGGTRDLPPGQALVVGSSVVGATVLLRETDVAGDVVGELASGLGGESA